MRISDWSSDVCSSDLRLVDQCADIGANQKCRLDSESVDGVKTFLNGVGTGLRPLPRSRQFGTGSCTATLTRDFFLRQRTYKCAIDTGAMPEPDLSRGAHILDPSTDTLPHDRVRSAAGGSPPPTHPLPPPHRGTAPP